MESLVPRAVDLPELRPANATWERLCLDKARECFEAAGIKNGLATCALPHPSPAFRNWASSLAMGELILAKEWERIAHLPPARALDKAIEMPSPADANWASLCGWFANRWLDTARRLSERLTELALADVDPGQLSDRCREAKALAVAWRKLAEAAP